jgi:hypothetical protein
LHPLLERFAVAPLADHAGQILVVERAQQPARQKARHCIAADFEHALLDELRDRLLAPAARAAQVQHRYVGRHEPHSLMEMFLLRMTLP